MPRPPGPGGGPIGLASRLGSDTIGLLTELARDYGDVAYIRLGVNEIYSLNHPDLIEEVLVGKHQHCLKDWGTRELQVLVGQGLLTSEGDFWRRQRKLAAPPLQPKRIAAYGETMTACAARMFSVFRDDEVRDVQADMLQLTLEIVGRTLLGTDARRDAERIAAIVDVAMAFFHKRLWTVQAYFPTWVPMSERRALRQGLVELDAIVYGMIARCRQQGERQPGKAGALPGEETLLARLCAARDDEGQPMNDKQLRDEAITMLLAGHETTALALTFAIYLLSEHQDALARVREEVDAKLGAQPATVGDLPALRYVDAVVRETLRLYPPAYAIGREVVEPFELGGYALPKGVEVIMIPYAVHRDPRFWKEPDRFWPERWLEPSIAQLPKLAYFPFGGGPRICIGNHFAMMELALVLATLVQHVELRVVPGYALKLDPIVTLRPAEHLRALVRRRKPRELAPQHGAVSLSNAPPWG